MSMSMTDELIREIAEEVMLEEFEILNLALWHNNDGVLDITSLDEVVAIREKFRQFVADCVN